jgi:hypothetical protein
LGDYQLLRFMKGAENKGRVMRYGVWRYTRHPNYFLPVVSKRGLMRNLLMAVIFQQSQRSDSRQQVSGSRSAILHARPGPRFLSVDARKAVNAVSGGAADAGAPAI